MSPAPARDRNDGKPPEWYKPAIALCHIIPAERRALALAHRYLTFGDWGGATDGEKMAAMELIRRARGDES